MRVYKFIKFHSLVSLLLICVNTNAQRSTPTQYQSTIAKSYVRTWDAAYLETDPNNLPGKSIREVKQTTAYVDGLGRPLQIVVKKGSLITASSANTDLITSSEYDQYGRTIFQNLPYADPTANDGLFKLNPFQPQIDFYNTYLTGQDETNTSNNKNWAYSQTDYEASPLNRIDKQYSPGKSWVGNNISVSVKYWFNTAIDDVKKWSVTEVTNNLGMYNVSGSYSANVLSKEVSIDEYGKQVIEFKDKDGKVILKKMQLTATADNGSGTDYTGWLCTYYIYDNLNNLRCVIQPEGVKTLAIPANNWDLMNYSSGILLNEQCFRYEYDERNRMVIKKVPGTGEVWMVYDARDRLVLTQDANLRTASPQKWIYTLYDNLNRPIENGLWNNSQDRIYHKGQASSSTSYPNLTGQTYEQLSITGYDDYSTLPNASGLSSSFDNSYSAHFNSNYNSLPDYPQQQIQSFQTKGLITWTQIKVLGSSTWLYTVTIYDEKGRAIQQKSKNFTGGIDIVTTQYNWSGQALLITAKHEKATTPNAQTTVIVTRFTYDDLGRLVKTEKKVSNSLVNGNTMTPYKSIGEYEYDQLGNLKNKKLAPAYNNNAGIENLAYTYNIRGWLLGVNRNYLSTTGQSGTTKFGFELGYDKLTNSSVRNFVTAQYNGNITGIVWKSDGDDVKRKYDFSYDAVDRFLQGLFEQDDGINLWNTTTTNYKVLMGDGANSSTAYDYNGNIKSMSQYGWKLGGSSTIPIDNLTYNYSTGTNKLLQVTDANNDNLSRLGDFKYDPVTKTTSDYSYDANGNLTIDNNKKISSITYNYLNLPNVITFSGKGTITYTYDALGNKLKKEVNETGQSPKTTLYIGGAVYENEVLQFLTHEEGRVRVSNNSFVYDYFVKDYLGNVRMVLTDEAKTNDYPAATMEPGSINTESYIYGNLTNTQASKPTWFTDPLYPTNTQVSKIRNSSGIQKVGPNIILKVMAGDTYNIRVASGWNDANPADNNSTNVLGDLLTFLSAGAANLSNGKVSQGELQNSNSGLNSGLNNFLSTQTTNGVKPKAYINWILLDEQFQIPKDANGNIIIGDGYSGFEQVGNSGSATIHYKVNLKVNKSGYLYIYTSNEATNIDVYFDNLQVTHFRGPLIEETHYYPFGLTMLGISSKALLFGIENKFRFNQYEQQNKEFIDGSGLEWYDYKHRFFDNQLGRFFSVDGLADEYPFYTPYQFAGNEVPKGIDLDGLELQFGADGKLALDSRGRPIFHQSPAPTEIPMKIPIYAHPSSLPPTTTSSATVGDCRCPGSYGIGPYKEKEALSAKNDPYGPIIQRETKEKIERRAGNFPVISSIVKSGAYAMNGYSSEAIQSAKGGATEAALMVIGGPETALLKGGKYAFGLKGEVVDFAEQIGAKHLMSDKNWRISFTEIISNPNNELHFTLKGIDQTPMQMILNPARSGINWELHTLYQSPAFNNTIFYYGGNTYRGLDVFKIKL